MMNIPYAMKSQGQGPMNSNGRFFVAGPGAQFGGVGQVILVTHTKCDSFCLKYTIHMLLRIKITFYIG